MVGLENFVKSMPPSLSELKVLPSFCFAFKIPNNVAASRLYSTVPTRMQKGFGSVHEPIAYTSQAQNRFDQLKVVLDRVGHRLN